MKHQNKINKKQEKNTHKNQKKQKENNKLQLTYWHKTAREGNQAGCDGRRTPKNWVPILWTQHFPRQPIDCECAQGLSQQPGGDEDNDNDNCEDEDEKKREEINWHRTTRW